MQPKLDYESEEEEDIPQQAEERPRDQFVQNPEELRALAEQRRLSRRGHRFGPSPAQRNVVGNTGNIYSTTGLSGKLCSYSLIMT